MRSSRSCPVYGDPLTDKSRRVRFVGRMSKFLRCGLVQYPLDSAFGLPEFLTIVFCLLSSNVYTGEDVAPAASLSNPEGEYPSPPKNVAELSPLEDSSGIICVTLCFTSAVCTLLQMARSIGTTRRIWPF